jgi:hypothetical protein
MERIKGCLLIHRTTEVKELKPINRTAPALGRFPSARCPCPDTLSGLQLTVLFLARNLPPANGDLIVIFRYELCVKCSVETDLIS